MFDISSLIDNFVILIILFCAVSVVLTVIAGFVVWRRISHWSSPDTKKLRSQFAELSAKHPNRAEKGNLQQIINQQAFKCGIIGAVTSFGGFYTLPIALPIDIILSTQIQATLVEFIATTYGIKNTSELENRIRTYIVATGSTQLTNRTSAFLMKFLLRLSGRSFAKLIPFIGGFIGFAVNYSITRATANVAVKWYSQQAQV